MNETEKMKRALLLFYPNRYFFEVYTSNEEILEDLSYIKQIPSCVIILNKLLRLFLSIDEGKLKATSYTKQKLLRTIKIHVKQYGVDSFRTASLE